MLYRNVITGAEFESKSIISAPNWIAVGAETPHLNPEVKEPAQAEPPQDQKEEKKTVTKKAAPKKTTKRIKK